MPLFRFVLSFYFFGNFELNPDKLTCQVSLRLQVLRTQPAILAILSSSHDKRESLTHKLLTENQKLSCSKHLVSQVSQRPESKTKEKAGKRHAHFSPHT